MLLTATLRLVDYLNGCESRIGPNGIVGRVVIHKHGHKCDKGRQLQQSRPIFLALRFLESSNEGAGLFLYLPRIVAFSDAKLVENPNFLVYHFQFIANRHCHFIIVYFRCVSTRIPVLHDIASACLLRLHLPRFHSYSQKLKKSCKFCFRYVQQRDASTANVCRHLLDNNITRTMEG